MIKNFTRGLQKRLYGRQTPKQTWYIIGMATSASWLFLGLVVALTQPARSEEQKSYGKPLPPISWCDLTKSGQGAEYLCQREKAYQQSSGDQFSPMR